MGPSSMLGAGHSHPRCPHRPSRARPELGTARTGGDGPGPPAASGPAWSARSGTAQSGLSRFVPEMDGSTHPHPNSANGAAIQEWGSNFLWGWSIPGLALSVPGVPGRVPGWLGWDQRDRTPPVPVSPSTPPPSSSPGDVSRGRVNKSRQRRGSGGGWGAPGGAMGAGRLRSPRCPAGKAVALPKTPRWASRPGSRLIRH